MATAARAIDTFSPKTMRNADFNTAANPVAVNAPMLFVGAWLIACCITTVCIAVNKKTAVTVAIHTVVVSLEH